MYENFGIAKDVVFDIYSECTYKITHHRDTQIQIFVQDQVIIANLERVLSRKWKLNGVISLGHLYFWRPILTLSSAFI